MTRERMLFKKPIRILPASIKEVLKHTPTRKITDVLSQLQFDSVRTKRTLIQEEQTLKLPKTAHQEKIAYDEPMQSVPPDHR